MLSVLSAFPWSFVGGARTKCPLLPPFLLHSLQSFISPEPKKLKLEVIVGWREKRSKLHSVLCEVYKSNLICLTHSWSVKCLYLSTGKVWLKRLQMEKLMLYLCSCWTLLPIFKRKMNLLQYLGFFLVLSIIFLVFFKVVLCGHLCCGGLKEGTLVEKEMGSELGSSCGGQKWLLQMWAQGSTCQVLLCRCGCRSVLLCLLGWGAQAACQLSCWDAMCCWPCSASLLCCSSWRLLSDCPVLQG